MLLLYASKSSSQAGLRDTHICTMHNKSSRLLWNSEQIVFHLCLNIISTYTLVVSASAQGNDRSAVAKSQCKPSSRVPSPTSPGAGSCQGNVDTQEVPGHITETHTSYFQILTAAHARFRSPREGMRSQYHGVIGDNLQSHTTLSFLKPNCNFLLSTA